MDLLKFSKKIVPYGMIGLMLANSAAPAFAHGNQEADINSFQNSQSVTITQQIEQTQEVEANPQSLSVFQDHITGKFFSAKHVSEHGGTYNNPLNPEEVIFFNVDGKNEILRDIFKNKVDYDSTLRNSDIASKVFFVRGKSSSANVFKKTDNINDADYIYLGSKDIRDFAMDLKSKGIDYKDIDFAERFVFYHEFAHSLSNMENQFNNVSKKDLMSFEFQNPSESFADVFASIAVYKDMQENKSGKDLENSFNDFIVALSNKRTIDFLNVDRQYEGKKGIDPHYSQIPLFVLSAIHSTNPDLLKDIDMKQAQQLSAVIVNRTLNHSEVQEVLFENKQRNISNFAENTQAKSKLFNQLGKDILNDIKDMIKVDENGKVFFEYNSDAKSKILKDKPKSYKI